eukprot:30920-Pelagococcus_subviridis.AAC.8
MRYTRYTLLSHRAQDSLSFTPLATRLASVSRRAKPGTNRAAVLGSNIATSAGNASTLPTMFSIVAAKMSPSNDASL